MRNFILQLGREISLISDYKINILLIALFLLGCFAVCKLFFSRKVRKIINAVVMSITIMLGICALPYIIKQFSPEEQPTSSEATGFVDAEQSLENNDVKNKNESLPYKEVEGQSIVHFLNVGQADCTIIENDGQIMLIDCGNYADIDVVSSYLDGLGIKKIDYFITTHPHEDHIGCAASILRLYEVGLLIKPEKDNDTACYSKMMENVKKYDVKVAIPKSGDIYSFGDASFQILGPISKDNELNNNSIVMRYAYGNTSFLFTGDAEREEEQEILEPGLQIKSDVIKVGHHGSSSSSSYPWLREVMPRYAVIQVGNDNSYGHPHDDTLSKYRDVEAELFRTDKNGTIVMTTDGVEIEVFCEK